MNFILAFLLITRLAAAAALGPDSFTGDFRLVDARYGLLCFSELHGFLDLAPDGSASVDLGPWYFSRVNSGRHVFEDELSRDRSESFTTATKLVSRRETFTKAIRETTLSYTEATLTGGRLHVESRSHTFSPGDPRGFETVHECVYRRQ